MTLFTIQFLSKTSRLCVSVSNSHIIADFLAKGKPLSIDEGWFFIDKTFFATPEIKCYFKGLSERLAEDKPAFNRLKAFFDKLENHNVVFVITKEIEDDYARELITDYLKVCESSQDLSGNIPESPAAVQIKKIFADISHDYLIYTPVSSGSKAIGNSKKNKRICRFCGLSIESGVSFSKKAHAIPESLGNKSLMLYDECDSCNGYFGNEVEPHLIEYLNLYRVAAGVKGKRGYPKIKMSDAVFSYSNDKINVQTESARLHEDGSIALNIESKQGCIPLRAYKGLCKIIISTLPRFDRDNFCKLLGWMLDADNNLLSVPPVYMGLLGGQKSAMPSCELTTFERRIPDRATPLIFAELRIGDIVLVYSLPESATSVKEDKVKAAIDNYAWAQHVTNLNKLDFSTQNEIKAKYELISKP